ncbi:MAG: hypothetical protein U0930_12310 [Pirellulales bacterium]
MMELKAEMERPSGTVRAPSVIVRAIEMVVQFYWDDEFQHFVSLTKEERRNNRHVFQELRLIRRWLSKVHRGGV